MAKRALDLLVCVPVLAILAPIWAVLAFLVKLESPGPVLFRQVRVGKDGRLFTMYKMRSMYADAEDQREDLYENNEMEGGILFKMRADPRITRMGRILRRWSLDETPQFLNVLKGDMSLVGPRPPLPHEVEQYTPEQFRRMSVTPGLTCLWQIYGRSEIPFAKQVKLDVFYIDNRSLWFDVKILVLTIPAVLLGKGAF